MLRAPAHAQHALQRRSYESGAAHLATLDARALFSTRVRASAPRSQRALASSEQAVRLCACEAAMASGGGETDFPAKIPRTAADYEKARRPTAADAGRLRDGAAFHARNAARVGMAPPLAP